MRAALDAVASSPGELARWHKLAELIDGARVNFEECLASVSELSALDQATIVRWDRYIWLQVHERFPDDLTSAEEAAEYYVGVLDEPTLAAPFIEQLLAHDPRHAAGLRLKVQLDAIGDDIDGARAALLVLAEVAPRDVIHHGLLDHFDEHDWDFVRPVAVALIDAIGAEAKGYEGKLRERLTELVAGPTPRPPREVARPRAEAWGYLVLPLSDLELSFAAQAAAQRTLGVATVGELIAYSDEAARAAGVPLGVIMEWNEVLAELGLSLGAGRYRPTFR